MTTTGEAVTDHADTIREANDRLREATGGDYMAGESDAALDALLAERQQAIDALRRLTDAAEARAKITHSALTDEGNSRAVREEAKLLVVEFVDATDAARAALLSLGEQP